MPSGRCDPGAKTYDVRVCAFSHEMHHKDTSGFYSVEFDAWFSNPTCYNLMRLKTGSLDVTKNKHLFETLVAIRDKHYPAHVIQRNREKLAHKIRSGEVRVIRQVHRDRNDRVEVE